MEKTDPVAGSPVTIGGGITLTEVGYILVDQDFWDYNPGNPGRLTPKPGKLGKITSTTVHRKNSGSVPYADAIKIELMFD
jgi:hypothetical protein